MGKLKGRALEKRIERVIKQLEYAQIPFLPIRLHPKTIRKRGQIIFVEKQPADFVFITPRGVALLDAKECKGDKWYPKSAPAHQLISMRKMQVMGHRAGFIVWFTKYSWLPQSCRLIEDFSRPATMESGVEFKWELFL